MNRIELALVYAVVSDVESGGNPCSFRFEPRFADRISERDKALVRARKYYNANEESLKLLLSTSVGRIQILIYNLFFYDRIYRYLEENRIAVSIPFVLPEAQEREIFRLFLEERGINYFPFERKSLCEDFAVKYNGSFRYADLLWERWKALCGG